VFFIWKDCIIKNHVVRSYVVRSSYLGPQEYFVLDSFVDFSTVYIVCLFTFMCFPTYAFFFTLWVTVCKNMVRRMLSDRCLSVPSLL